MSDDLAFCEDWSEVTRRKDAKPRRRTPAKKDMGRATRDQSRREASVGGGKHCDENHRSQETKRIESATRRGKK
jgi:hypothetical protein